MKANPKDAEEKGGIPMLKKIISLTIIIGILFVTAVYFQIPQAVKEIYLNDKEISEITIKNITKGTDVTPPDKFNYVFSYTLEKAEWVKTEKITDSLYQNVGGNGDVFKIKFNGAEYIYNSSTAMLYSTAKGTSYVSGVPRVLTNWNLT